MVECAGCAPINLGLQSKAVQNSFRPAAHGLLKSGGEMKKRRRLGRGVAVVGAGMSRFGMFKDKDSKDLFAEAFKEMLASVDKGLDPDDREDHDLPERDRFQKQEG